MTSPANQQLNFFAEQQRVLMTCILDQIIPPGRGGELAGAGQLGMVDYLDRVVGASARLKRVFSRGLTRITMLAGVAEPSGFGDLPQTRQVEVLRQVEAAEPTFFDALVRHTYNGYYTHPKIIQLLGIETHPPQPRGYQVEPGDLTGLEQVKQRGQHYRDTGG